MAKKTIEDLKKALDRSEEQVRLLVTEINEEIMIKDVIIAAGCISADDLVKAEHLVRAKHLARKDK